MSYPNPTCIKKDKKISDRFSVFVGLLTGLLVFNALGLAQAADGDHKEAISSWRSEGQIYSLSKNQAFYMGLMKGTFFVKDVTPKTHYMHAARMDCPFSVHIDDSGKDVMQGVCQFIDQKGNTANAAIACTGPKEDCKGKLTFTSGTGNFKGINGGGLIKIRVDLLHEDVTGNLPQSFGNNMKAHGYLVIRDLQNNVTNEDGYPVVR